MVPASGAHTGRVTPRVTLKVTSLPVPDSASIRSTPSSRSSWRLAMLSASPVQGVATQLTHCAAVHDADAEGAVRRGHRLDGDDLPRHLADRGAPVGERAPAWLGLPVASRLKRAMA